jgi:prevent-host-death family protein
MKSAPRKPSQNRAKERVSDIGSITRGYNAFGPLPKPLWEASEPVEARRVLPKRADPGNLTILDRLEVDMRQSLTNPHPFRRSATAVARSLPVWQLQDAKAHFSEVVREARTRGPQRVTVHGKDAVVVLSAEDYARLASGAAQPSLHALLSRSPLRDLDFEYESVRSPVRDIEL